MFAPTPISCAASAGGITAAQSRASSGAPAAKLRLLTQKVHRCEGYLSTVQIKQLKFTLLFFFGTFG
jgi:hypothetical protein